MRPQPGMSVGSALLFVLLQRAVSRHSGPGRVPLHDGALASARSASAGADSLTMRLTLYFVKHYLAYNGIDLRAQSCYNRGYGHPGRFGTSTRRRRALLPSHADDAPARAKVDAADRERTGGRQAPFLPAAARLARRLAPWQRARRQSQNALPAPQDT